MISVQPVLSPGNCRGIAGGVPAATPDRSDRNPVNPLILQIRVQTIVRTGIRRIEESA